MTDINSNTFSTDKIWKCNLNREFELAVQLTPFQHQRGLTPQQQLFTNTKRSALISSPNSYHAKEHKNVDYHFSPIGITCWLANCERMKIYKWTSSDLVEFTAVKITTQSYIIKPISLSIVKKVIISKSNAYITRRSQFISTADFLFVLLIRLSITMAFH